MMPGGTLPPAMNNEDVKPENSDKPVHEKGLELIAVVYWVSTFLIFGLTALLLSILLPILLVTLGITILTKEQEPLRGHLQEDTPLRFAVVLVTDARLQFTFLFLLLSGYLWYWYQDYGSEEHGSHHKTFLRRLKWWRYQANYFPVQLVLSKEIEDYTQSTVTSPEVNYLVGFHPHGIFSIGAFVNFCTDATGFSKAFPTLKPWVAILPIHFKIPFYRDLLMSFNIVSASKRGLTNLLDPRVSGETGNFVVVVLGGAAEALESRPGRYVLHTSYRYGFFKLALQTGAHLIPCFSFGEPRMYNQLGNEPGSRIRRLQDWFLRLTTFPVPIFYGRGPFPLRTPVNTVIGAPIICERIESPTKEQIADIKSRYLRSLKELFQKYKKQYDPHSTDLEFV